MTIVVLVIKWLLLVSGMAVMTAGSGVMYWVYLMEDQPSAAVASCEDCYCIPTDGSSVCPLDKKPETTFDPVLLEQLEQQALPLNPYRLECNPYEDSSCQTTPPQEFTELGDQAVCGIHYHYSQLLEEAPFSVDGESCSEMPSSYRIQTYPSWEVATSAGAFVTHSGACGVCSTTQDLAAYMRTFDLATAVTTCAKQSVQHGIFDDGDTNSIMDCLMYEIGFTEECANIWYANVQETFHLCGAVCALSRMRHEPNNGPGPQCALNDCLQCDETGSGPVFQRVAGRTRRRTGLLSAIARPCGSIAPITHTACPPRQQMDAGMQISLHR